jgi:hypothetical protein
MNLQKQISRIQSMMGVINEDNKKTISYSAVVLDHESSELLLNTFKGEIPDGWKKYAHHMTIALGKAIEDENLLGSSQTLIVTQIGKSDMVIAVRVEGFPSKNKIPHVTLAVNPEGGKPFMSNKIEEWKDIEPFEITGEVRNIYNTI